MVKNVRALDEVCKARFVIQNHSDSEKNMVVHSFNNIRQQTIRLIIAVESIFHFKLWSQKVSQAYLKGQSKLAREVYVRSKEECNLKPDQLLKLMKPLYELTDSSDYWFITL